MFATTGVLLRKLQGDPALQGVTHIVVDEGSCALLGRMPMFVGSCF